MNIVFFVFYNEYYYSPTTLLHRINYYFKIYVIFSILVGLPYFNFDIIHLNYYILTITFSILLYPLNLFNLLISKSLLYNCILNFCLLYWSINSKNNNHYNDKIKVYFPNYLNIINTNQNQTIKQIYIKYDLYLLPKYLFKIIYIHFFNFFILKILFIVTKQELIFSTLIKFLKRLDYFQNLNYNKYMLIFTLSFQSIQRITTHFSELYMSLQIKYGFTYLDIKYLVTNVKIFTKFFSSYIINIFENVIYITRIVWTRKITFRNCIYRH